MKEITVQAIPENLQLVLDFVHSELKTFNYSIKKLKQLELAVEEIYINITSYAYYPKIGTAIIRCEMAEDPLQIQIQFIDNGKTFNPLDAKEPVITMTAEERDIGGLGFYLVKKSVDQVNYEYLDGKNILTIQKRLDREA